MLTKRLRLLTHAFSNASIQNRLKYLVVSAGLIAVLLYFSALDRQWEHPENPFRDGSRPHHHDHDPQQAIPHPIYQLTQDAEVRFNALIAKKSNSLEEAADRYRERRGRHPPPGFGAWYAAAENSSAVMVEDFFDRIYHDINPFWALDPQRLRRMIKDEQHYIRVRDGKAWFVSDHIELRQPWVQRWTELVQEMMPHLPDLDMILNVMDETRVLVPWEDMAGYVAEEQRGRRLVRPSEALVEYTKYPNDTDTDTDTNNNNDDKNDNDKVNAESKISVDWITGEQHQYWDHYRVTCPPDSPGRNVASLTTLNRPPTYPTSAMPFATNGYISNFTAATDPCQQPHIRGMHGTFIESVSMATTHSLFPMFGGCKLPGNNEMLIPAGMILDSYDMFSGGETHGGNWTDKKDGLVWRGVASGGRNKEDNWWAFQRHRFVQMMNGSTVSLALGGNREVAPSFDLSGLLDQYEIKSAAAASSVMTGTTDDNDNNNDLGKWVSSFSDVAFMGYECFPRQDDGGCAYMEPYMELRPAVHMKEQYEYKFLPDIDGNSYSGRFRAFMRSTSLVLKSTVYAEWHDDRLVPWVHFVPFDNTYADIYGIMDYYLGARHDDEAARIAEVGRDWAERVMRREDMKLYVWRLLLEYARVMDPARDRLAFVDDLSE